VNKSLSGHLLGEYFMPGSYYASSNQDDAFFLRFNLEYTFYDVGCHQGHTSGAPGRPGDPFQLN
jgi:hypothetical protein